MTIPDYIQASTAASGVPVKLVGAKTLGSIAATVQ
jgi:hypothetical protein